MLLLDFTFKYYTIKSGLLSSCFLFKYVQEVSFHDSSMNFFMKMVCFSSKYLKSYNFGKRTKSEKRKPVSGSATESLPEKVNLVKKKQV